MTKEDLLEAIDVAKIASALGSGKTKEVTVKESSGISIKKIVTVVLAIAAIAGIAFAIYHFFFKKDEDEFDEWDDELFDDEFDDFAQDDVETDDAADETSTAAEDAFAEE